MDNPLRRTAGHRAHHPCSGFTLIEILVVVAIVGIILAVVSVNLLPDDRRTLSTEAERLALLLELGRDTATARGETLAWVAESGHYEFLRQDERGDWLPDQDPSLRARAFPAGVALAGLSVDHAPAVPGERLLFTPSGVNAPFEIELALGPRRARITGNAAGRVEVARDE